VDEKNWVADASCVGVQHSYGVGLTHSRNRSVEFHDNGLLGTINGTIVGQEFTVNINIRDADEISGWQAGLIFDPTVLGCTGFLEGEFLKSAGSTKWSKGTINNVTGAITFHACSLYGSINASGDGRLAYINFAVVAPGVSDLHFRDVKVLKIDEWGMVFEAAINIIDVYTVVEVTPPQTVVIESNSTGSTGQYDSGFYDHFFNLTLNEISFVVTGPKPGFSNITIPKTLLNTSNLDNWIVKIDDIPLDTQERTATENNTHTFLYFTYSLGIHEVQITTRPLVSSTVSINLSSTTVALGNNVTINGNVTADDPVDPARENAAVTIRYRLSGGDWAALANVTTDANSNYTYVWTPDAAGTYELKASWTGDKSIEGDESDPPYPALTAEEAPPPAGIDPYVVAAVVVAVIIIAAIAIYFVKFRKPG